MQASTRQLVAGGSIVSFALTISFCTLANSGCYSKNCNGRSTPPEASISLAISSVESSNKHAHVVQVSLKNNTSNILHFAKAINDSPNGISDFILFYGSKDGRAVWNPQPLSKIWPQGQLITVFRFDEKKTIPPLAVGECRILTEITVPVVDRKQYKIWCTLFLPFEGTNSVQAWSGEDAGITIQSNPLVFSGY